ncbi:MAG: DnaA regulatory inactivator Hda [Burkholderiaceae bacterium]|nr:DnaA regulatory inactivator Hda [Burkholderiaceae bacterium]
MHQIALDLHRVEAPTLDNFVPGRNGEALACLRALRRAPGAGVMPTPGAGVPPTPGAGVTPTPGAGVTPTPGASVPLVYLWGEAGCGKTHLATAAADAGHALAADAPHAAFEALIADAAEQPRIVAVLDVERLDEERQSLLFHLINRARAQPDSTVLATGAQPPLGLALRDDLRTRLGSGLVFRLHLLDDREKAAALERVARERGVTVAPDVIPWLIAHTSRDIRALLRTFDALDRRAFERRRAITLPLLRELLQETGALPAAAASDGGGDTLPS